MKYEDYIKLFQKGHDYARSARLNWVARKGALMLVFEPFRISPDESAYKTRLWLIILELFERTEIIEEMLRPENEGLDLGGDDEVGDMLSSLGIDLPG